MRVVLVQAQAAKVIAQAQLLQAVCLFHVQNNPYHQVAQAAVSVKKAFHLLIFFVFIINMNV